MTNKDYTHKTVCKNAYEKLKKEITIVGDDEFFSSRGFKCTPQKTDANYDAWIKETTKNIKQLVASIAPGKKMEL